MSFLVKRLFTANKPSTEGETPQGNDAVPIHEKTFLKHGIKKIYEKKIRQVVLKLCIK